jgi:DNA-binding NarL/FixJ family response regulator
VKAGGRVLIADGHPLTREGLSLAARSALLGSVIVGVGSIADALVEVVRRIDLRMILLDLQLPDARGYSGLMALQFRAPAVPIVVVTAREDPALVDAACALGAAGFLFKSLPLDTIAAHLRDVDAGRTFFPPLVRQAP